MIIRQFGARSGQRALAAPIQCLRSLSTDTTSTTSVPDTAPVPSSNQPRVFTKAAKAALAKRQKIVQEYAAEKYHADQQVKAITQKVGSTVTRRYHEDAMLFDPPSAKDITLELLMANQTHMGHNQSLWNPSNSRYIYGVRQGIHIISLEETAAHLRRAARVVEEVARAGGVILFAGTRKGQMEYVANAARLAGGYHLFTKWTPGTITNRDAILSGGTLKVVDELDRNLKGFDRHLLDRRPLLPDLVVCLNPMENFVMLYECGLKNVPTIGVIDTDANPSWVTYAIPANDDSLRSVGLIAGVLGRAGEAGQKHRLADAAAGTVRWQTPRDITAFMVDQQHRAREESKRRAGGGRDGLTWEWKPLNHEVKEVAIRHMQNLEGAERREYMRNVEEMVQEIGEEEFLRQTREYEEREKRREEMSLIG